MYHQFLSDGRWCWSHNIDNFFWSDLQEIIVRALLHIVRFTPQTVHAIILGMRNNEVGSVFIPPIYNMKKYEIYSIIRLIIIMNFQISCRLIDWPRVKSPRRFFLFFIAWFILYWRLLVLVSGMVK